jgi:outer membrane receptor for ferrienterochelin and colicins
MSDRVLGGALTVLIRGVTRTACLGVAVIALLFPLHEAIAQASPAEPVLATGIVPVLQDGKSIYTVGQFARFAPQTAADIAQQIPGFTISQISNDRGLGEGSQNVLINGQRITGKGNDALTVLRRIPVSAVLRMEIIDSADLDISGLSGHVLNVVAEQGSVQGNYAWRPVIRQRIPDFWPGGEVNVSGKSGMGDFSLGFRWDGFRGGGWGGETESHPSTGVSFFRAQLPHFAEDNPRLTGSLNHKLVSGSIWNLNTSVNRDSFRRHNTTLYTFPGDPQTTEISRSENAKWRTEIGSDFEFALGPGRLKLIGLYTERKGPNNSELTSLPDGATVPTGSRFMQDSTEGERVLRSEYRWKAWGSDWTLSAEGAQNFIDATGALDDLDSAGIYQPVELVGASSRVEERRGESILSFSRSLGKGTQLQVSGGAEYSVLKQNGDAGQTRRFVRPKGAVSLAWNPASKWEMNLKLQRKVGQLDFFDFLSSVDVNTNTANTSNHELVPPQSWLAQLETSRSLGSRGKLRLTLEAEEFSDFVTQIPISPTLEAPGNLPKARRLIATLNTTLLLDDIGIPGGKVDSLATLRETRVRDPLLGTYRPFNGNKWYWNVDFRQDIPDTPWTWGLYTEDSARSNFYRLDYKEVDWSSRPFGQIFLEHKHLFGLKVRFAVANLYNTRDRAEELFYVARRDGPVDFRRDYGLTFHPFYRITVSGTF